MWQKRVVQDLCYSRSMKLWFTLKDWFLAAAPWTPAFSMIQKAFSVFEETQQVRYDTLHLRHDTSRASIRVVNRPYPPASDDRSNE
jgi:hypothetical protein